MIYLNENDGLYYTDAEFTTLANGFDVEGWSGYYIEGVLTTLNGFGFGTWNDVFYANGSPDPNYTGPDYWDWIYYIESQPTSLDINGDGGWDGNTYVNGVMLIPAKNGWIENIYWINDVATTLDSSGNGTWNGLTFVNGDNLNYGLQAFYKLSDLTDSSGNENTLINNNGVTFSSGKIGDAATLDGNGQTLSTTVNGGGYVDGMSVSLWMRKTGQKPTCGLIQAAAGDYSGWTIINENNSNWFLLAGSGYGWSLQTIPFLNVDGDWHHIVISNDNLNIRVYVDGMEVANYSTVQYTQAPIKIGTYDYFSGSSSESFDGQIDAVGIWNRALKLTEITELYNSGAGLEEFDAATPIVPTQRFIKIQDTVKFFGKVKFVS